MPVWEPTDAPYINTLHHQEMVKARGVTLVALATLLAGFVASCSSGDMPSPADLQSSTSTIEVVIEDEDNSSD